MEAGMKALWILTIVLLGSIAIAIVLPLVSQPVEYRIVDGYTDSKVTKEIVELMADGWIPQGGATSTMTEEGSYWCSQAMVRRKYIWEK